MARKCGSKADLQEVSEKLDRLLLGEVRVDDRLLVEEAASQQPVRRRPWYHMKRELT